VGPQYIGNIFKNLLKKPMGPKSSYIDKSCQILYKRKFVEVIFLVCLFLWVFFIYLFLFVCLFVWFFFIVIIF
jgi:hypothetical protein